MQGTVFKPGAKIAVGDELYVAASNSRAFNYKIEQNDRVDLI